MAWTTTCRRACRTSPTTPTSSPSSFSGDGAMRSSGSWPEKTCFACSRRRNGYPRASSGSAPRARRRSRSSTASGGRACESPGARDDPSCAAPAGEAQSRDHPAPAMTGAPRDANAVLAAAAEEFVAATRGTLVACEAVVARLRVAPDDAAALDTVRRCVHRLNGSAGTFGFARAGRMAAAVEGVVRRWLADPALDRDRRADVLATFLAAVRPLFDAAAVSPRAPSRAPSRALWLVDLRDRLAAGLAAEATSRGYVAERVARDELDEALA